MMYENSETLSTVATKTDLRPDDHTHEHNTHNGRAKGRESSGMVLMIHQAHGNHSRMQVL